MISTILTALSPYRLYIYVALAVAGTGLIFGYGYTQKLKGRAECQQAYAEQRAEYEQKVRKEERKRAQDALKKETEVSKQIATSTQKKKEAQDEALRLAREANRPDSCALSDDELRYYQEAVSTGKE